MREQLDGRAGNVDDVVALTAQDLAPTGDDLGTDVTTPLHSSQSERQLRSTEIRGRRVRRIDPISRRIAKQRMQTLLVTLGLGLMVIMLSSWIGQKSAGLGLPQFSGER